MRATKGYVAGIGTTSALIGAIGCAFAVLSTLVAVHGWPLALGAPGTSTIESRGAAAEDALPSLGLPGPAEAARRAPADRSGRAHLRAGVVPASVEPVASAFGPSAGAPPHRSASGGTVTAGPAAGAAGPGRSTGSDAVARPAPATRSDSDAGGPTQSPTPPPSSGSGSAPTLGGTVTEVTSGAGTAVSQTGQQLGGAVQGATGQLGGTVGQVSPAVGQAVTQTGQVVGGVVSGATGAAGQVVSGTGATAGRLLGRLTGGR